MSALVDDLGIWVQLGIVQPDWNWQAFPVSSSTSNSIFRLTTLGEDLEQIKTFIYSRVLYLNSGTNIPDSQWKRFYPKQGSEIINLDTNPLFLYSNISRLIEVRKSSRWYGYKRPITDIVYSLQLEKFVPFENVINNANNIPQLTEAINLQLQQLKNELTQDIVNQILSAIPGSNNQGIGGGDYNPSF